MDGQRDTPQGWAVLELMGHRRLAGMVSEVEFAGAKLIRIDVPGQDLNGAPNMVTQFYSASALYCLTPTTEEIARSVAARNRIAPVYVYELPRLGSPRDDDEDAVGYDDEDAVGYDDEGP